MLSPSGGSTNRTLYPALLLHRCRTSHETSRGRGCAISSRCFVADVTERPPRDVRSRPGETLWEHLLESLCVRLLASLRCGERSEPSSARCPVLHVVRDHCPQECSDCADIPGSVARTKGPEQERLRPQFHQSECTDGLWLIRLVAGRPASLRVFPLSETRRCGKLIHKRRRRRH